MTQTPDIDAAWRSLNDALDFAVGCVAGDPDPLDERELADGNQYVMRVLAAVTESSLLTFDPTRPAFLPMMESVRYLGAAGPDIDYDVALVEPGVPHRITGVRGDATYVGIAVYGFAGDRGATGIVASIDVDDLVDADGRYVYEFDHPEAARVIIRHYFHDRVAQTPGSATIERLDTAGTESEATSAHVLSVALPTLPGLAARISNAAHSLRWNAQLNTLWTPELRAEPNRLVRQTADDIVAAVSNPDVVYAFSWWRIETDEVLVIDVDPPECAYWSIQLCDRWFQCQPERRTNLNDLQLVAAADGTVRIVVAHDDPGHPNWIDTSGHHTGTMFFRWLHADPEVLPQCTVMPRSAFAREST